MSDPETPSTPLSSSKIEPTNQKRSTKKNQENNHVEVVKRRRESVTIRKDIEKIKSALAELKLRQEELEIDLEEKEGQLREAESYLSQFIKCDCGQYFASQGMKSHQKSCKHFQSSSNTENTE